FNIDWFELVDTSPHGAITLKHQIAEQTAGPVTLEFRFNLPQRMDGATWQLCNLQQQAAVNLMTSGTNLCWGNGQVLTPYTTNQDYGVKVIADLTAQTATVYVNGDLVASGLPFVNPVGALDYFLVKTGDAATGAMFLDPVNIYIGYTVNETFVTCGVGKVPADWQVTNGSVQEFDCGTKPDVFSLQVTNGAAQRQFTSLSAKTVLECRFLIPGATNGLSVNLGGVELAGLMTYRTNFWYMAKVIADPTSNVADIYINGKLWVTGAPYTNPVASIYFAGNLWVDDVQVYPWQDYPTNYVPTPQPCPAVSPYILGVQSCNLWREGTAYAGWDYIYPYRDQRKPYLGWYDEGNPEEADWEIKWQVEHGITFEQYCWYRPDNAIGHPIKNGVLDQGIIQGLFNARYSDLAKFTIMCVDQGACTTDFQDWTNNIIPYWIEYFFKDPRYFKINGKPVVSIYEWNQWQQMFGGIAGGAQAIAELRAACQQAGFPGVIVMMEQRNSDAGVMSNMKAMGVDYAYSYTWGTPDVPTQENDNVASASAAASAGINWLPSISMGWDRQAWGVHDGGWTSVTNYQGLAQWTKDTFMPTLPAGSLGRQVVMLANWNEFGEGHFLMPSTLAGFGYLDALRNVFTAGSTNQDVAPDAQQQKRFTVLYPKD
ncbi:MAG TPA: glycoside hydrolase family 99-like domain-containing protein, partial [Verrucomicrobiae bacterium]|nr:glycoside hydrolase family 99-like domain-containing protein [Verrucomicrobiae bacterium]